MLRPNRIRSELGNDICLGQNYKYSAGVVLQHSAACSDSVGRS